VVSSHCTGEDKGVRLTTNTLLQTPHRAGALCTGYILFFLFFFNCSPIMSLGFAEIGQGYCIQNTTPEDVGGFQKIAILAYS